MAVYDLITDLGLLSKWNGSGNVIYHNDSQQVCQTGHYGSPCYWISGPNNSDNYTGIDPTTSCAKWAASYGGTYTLTKITDRQYDCRAYNQFGQYKDLTSTVQFGGPVTQVTEVDETEDTLAQKIGAQSGWPTNASRALADALGPYPDITVDLSDPPALAIPTPTVEGPTTTKQETVTKTNPDGSIAKDANGNPITGTKTTTTKTTYTPSPSGTRVTVPQVITTTSSTQWSDGTTSTDGSTTTTSEVDTTKTAPQEGAPTDQQQKDPCDTHPERIGCSQYGDPTGTDTLSKDQKAVTVTPAQFAGGGCPAPVAFSAFNRSYSFSYQPLCDKLALLAPLFAALAAFLAAWILADSFKVT
jgi:hypothetical protein